MSVGSRSSASAARAAERTAVRERESPRVPSIADLHALVEDPLGRRRPEAVGGRAQHQPGDPVGVLAPDPLGDDRAHRVAGDDRLLDAEHVEQRGGVVGAVVERELLGLDAAAVPALVEGDHPVALATAAGSTGNHVSSPVQPTRVQQQRRWGSPAAGPGCR